MNDDEIYDDFATKLGAYAEGRSPALSVAYPGRGFSPPESGFWLEAVWIPNETANYGMEDDAPSLLQGMAQVNVCYRPGHGIVGGLAVAGEIIQAFAKGTRFANMVRVYRKPWVANVIEDPDRIMHPVTIPWQGFNA